MVTATEPPPEDHEEQAIKVPRWIMVTLAVFLAGVVGVIVYGYLATPGWVGVSGKKFWDYLELLVVPGVLALGVYWLNRRQAVREQQAEDKRQAREDKAQAAQVEHALEVENHRAQDVALHTYLDQMGQLLLDEVRPLRQSKEGDAVRRLVRARTLTVLSRLDGHRQGSVLRFLSEAGMINRADPIITLGGTRGKASGSDRLDEKRGDPTMAAEALGEYALTLGGVKLEKVDLQGADLSGTDLSHVVLNFADLTGADLTDADLSGSLLVGANLMLADLSGATLDYAILQWASLLGASITYEEIRRLGAHGVLQGAMIPDGTRPFPVSPEMEAALREQPEHQLVQRERELEELAAGLPEQQTRKRRETLPNGQTYEEWLKDKEGLAADGENP